MSSRPEPTRRTEDWTTHALCANPNIDPELWFPKVNDRKRMSPEAEYQIAQAQAICKVCPVKTECLTLALEYARLPFGVRGVWGGVHFGIQAHGASLHRDMTRSGD